MVGRRAAVLRARLAKMRLSVCREKGARRQKRRAPFARAAIRHARILWKSQRIGANLGRTTEFSI